MFARLVSNLASTVLSAMLFVKGRVAVRHPDDTHLPLRVRRAEDLGSHRARFCDHVCDFEQHRLLPAGGGVAINPERSGGQSRVSHLRHAIIHLWPLCSAIA